MSKRYRIEWDTDSNPWSEWADQEVFTDEMSDDEKADWLDPERWESFGCIEQETGPCGHWHDTGEAVWSFDYHGLTAPVGHGDILTYAQLPPEMADHFPPVIHFPTTV